MILPQGESNLPHPAQHLFTDLQVLSLQEPAEREPEVLIPTLFSALLLRFLHDHRCPPGDLRVSYQEANPELKITERLEVTWGQNTLIEWFWPHPKNLVRKSTFLAHHQGSIWRVELHYSYLLTTLGNQPPIPTITIITTEYPEESSRATQWFYQSAGDLQGYRRITTTAPEGEESRITHTYSYDPSEKLVDITLQQEHLTTGEKKILGVQRYQPQTQQLVSTSMGEAVTPPPLLGEACAYLASSTPPKPQTMLSKPQELLVEALQDDWESAMYLREKYLLHRASTLAVTKYMISPEEREQQQEAALYETLLWWETKLDQ